MLYLAARRGGRITGVLPISRARSRIFGDCLVSLPLAVYGGVCADDAGSYRALLEAGSATGRSPGREISRAAQPCRAVPELVARPRSYVTFTQDLTAGPEKLMKGLPRDTRYAIRKGQKAGLEWTEDLTLQEFYDLYAQSVHRLGTPVFPRELFASLRSEFPKQVRLFGVRKGKDRDRGSAVLLFPRPGPPLLRRRARRVLQGFAEQFHVLEPDGAELERRASANSISAAASAERAPSISSPPGRCRSRNCRIGITW